MLLCVFSVTDHCKNISDTLGCASGEIFLFSPHFDVISDLLLNRHTAKWNLYVTYSSFEKGCRKKSSKVHATILKGTVGIFTEF